MKRWLGLLKTQLAGALRFLAQRDHPLTGALLRALAAHPSYRNVAILCLRWLDEVEAPGGALRPAGTAPSYGPAELDGRQPVVTIATPELRFRRFSQARVSALSSSVVLADRDVLIERAHGVDADTADYAAGHVLAHGARRAVVRLGEPERLARGIFLGGNGAFNYYHWLLEIFPKLELLPALPADYADVPLLLSEDARQTPAFAELLGLARLTRPVRYLDPSRSYVVDDLIYLDPVNSAPFNVRAGGRIVPAHFSIHAQSVAFLRSVVAKDAARRPRRKLMFCRRQLRRRYDQEPVLQRLQQLGFEPAFMGELGFGEQVALMRDADWIAGPAGAEWANLAFAQPGTRAVCWMAQESAGFSAFSNLARIAGVDLRHLWVRTDAASSAEAYEKSYRLDPEAIAAAITRLMSEPAATRSPA